VNWRWLALFPCILAVGCFPLVRDEAPPEDLAAGVVESLAPYPEILVLPVWKSVPFFKTDTTTGSTLLVDELFVVPGHDLAAVDRLVSSRTTAMIIVGAGAAVGRGISFQGFLLLAPDGTVVWTQSYGTSSWHGMPWSARLSTTWQAELAATLGEADEVACDRSSLFDKFPARTMEVDLDDAARVRGVAFVNNLTLPANGPSPEQWRSGIPAP
jgi:hypothetical protein